MNMLLPDQFTPIKGAKVRVAVYDIRPLREDYSFTPILLSVLRDLARDTDIIIEHCADVLNEVSLTEKRVEDALEKTDADLLIFGSYVATNTNVQPMIHLICTYGRTVEPSGGLPEGMDLNQAILEGDAILQMPRHILLRDVFPVIMVESLSYQNTLAEEIFYIAQFIQALKLYKEEKFEDTTRAVDMILTHMGSQERWPDYWAPFSYLHMLAGMAYLRAGNNQAAIYTLSNAMMRSTPAKMRIQRCAEQILASLLQARDSERDSEQGSEDDSEQVDGSEKA